MACLLMTYAGIILSFIGDVALAPGSMLAQETVVGVGLVLAAALVFSFAYLGTGVYTRRLGSLRFTATAMTAACLGTLIHGLTAEGLAPLQVPAPVWGYAAMLGAGGTVLATVCMNTGVRHLGAQRSAVISSVSPIMAIGLAWITLGETPSALQAVGMGLTIIGATAMALARGRSPVAPAKPARDAAAHREAPRASATSATSAS